MRIQRLLPGLLLAVFPLSGPAALSQDGSSQDVHVHKALVQDSAQVEEASAGAAPAPYVVTRGEGLLELLVPRSETLRYGAHLELGPVKARVGAVSLRAGVEEQKRSLLRPRNGSGGQAAWIEARAIGEYTVYTLDSRIETRFHDKEWPRLVHRMEQQGTERRRREVLIGSKDDRSALSYRADTRHGAPIGTRIWAQPTELSCPEGVLDSVGAVYLIRSMIRDGLDSTKFPMVDKHRLWSVEISLGEVQELEVTAGRFRARPVTLSTERLFPEDHPKEEDEGFSGPFGLRGQIQLWVEEVTGVPVLIAGTLPAGPLDIEIEIRLESFEGTPAEFGVLETDESPNG